MCSCGHGIVYVEVGISSRCEQRRVERLSGVHREGRKKAEAGSAVRTKASAEKGYLKMKNLTRYETRWNPFKDIEELHNRLNSLVGSTFGRAPLRGDGTDQETLAVTEWAPLVDITEDDKEYLIKVDLPEVKKEDLKVTVENGVLNISGERKFEKEEKGKKYHRVERAYGTFTRSFTLPEDSESGKVDASFKDGVLSVRLAKSEKAKPRSIDVKVS